MPEHSNVSLSHAKIAESTEPSQCVKQCVLATLKIDELLFWTHVFHFWAPQFSVWTPRFGWTPRLNYRPTMVYAYCTPV